MIYGSICDSNSLFLPLAAKSIADSEESQEVRREKRFKSDSEHEGTDTDDTVTSATSPMKEGATKSSEATIAQEVKETPFLALLAAIDEEEANSSSSAPQLLPFFTQPFLPMMGRPADMNSVMFMRPTPTSSAATTPLASPVLNYEMPSPFPVVPMPAFVPFTAY